MNNFRQFLFNKYLITCAVLVIVQQVILASSTVWLAKLGEAIVNRNELNIWFYLGLTLVCSFVVFIPPIFAMMLLQKAKFDLKNEYLFKFIDRHKGLATLSRNKELRDRLEPWPVAESDTIIQDFINFAYSSLIIVSTLIFSVVAILYVTESIMLIAYTCGLLITLASLRLSKPRIAKISHDYQEASLGVRKNLIKTWDNVFIGNTYNLENWRTKYLNSFAILRQKGVTLMAATEFFSSFPVILTSIPVGGAIVWLFHKNISDAVYLAALVATLPKQIQTIQNVHSFSYVINMWHGIKPRVIKLQESIYLASKSHENANELVDWAKLDIASDKNVVAKNLNELQSCIDQGLTGRITIRGPNGCGKSTLLALIKEIYQDAAIYLPANYDLDFYTTDAESLSTGQKRILELNEVINNDAGKLLLLDEWDANLDHKNISEISALLDKIAETNCLIEVRHR